MFSFRAVVLIASIALFTGAVAVGNTLAGEKFKVRIVKHDTK